MVVTEIDTSQVEKALEGTSKGLASIRRQTLGIVSRTVAKAIKNSIRATDLQKHTGELLKCYRYKVKKDGTQANVFPKALNGESTIFPKVMALNYGAEKGKWRLAPRGFVQNGKSIGIASSQAEIDKMIEKELQKYWG